MKASTQKVKNCCGKPQVSRRAFFVVGAEGSGTNMLAEAFVSAGCHYEPRHNSHLEDYEFEKMPDLLVFRRSIPHAGETPEFAEIRSDMEMAGYDILPIFIFREWNATIKSVLRRSSLRNVKMLESKIRYGLFRAVELFQHWGFIYITYEAFCLSENFRRWLFVERLGLKEPEIEIAYANEKYYR